MARVELSNGWMTEQGRVRPGLLLPSIHSSTHASPAPVAHVDFGHMTLTIINMALSSGLARDCGPDRPLRLPGMLPIVNMSGRHGASLPRETMAGPPSQWTQVIGTQ